MVVAENDARTLPHEAMTSIPHRMVTAPRVSGVSSAEPRYCTCHVRRIDAWFGTVRLVLLDQLSSYVVHWWYGGSTSTRRYCPVAE